LLLKARHHHALTTDNSMLEKTLTIVLAGSSGGRLKPLIENRAKAALPFGGKYRIIDFTLANCLNSGLRRILILTQHQSHSLQKHLRDGWSVFNPEIHEYITAVPPQIRAGESWDMGSASALYRISDILRRSKAEYALILRGDYIYRMDYSALIKIHRSRGGIATLACLETDAQIARGFSRLSIGDHGKITDISQKTLLPEDQTETQRKSLIPMGVTVVSMDPLLDSLELDYHNEHSKHDFCKNVLPQLDQQRSYAYHFGGSEGRVSIDKYWCTITTLDEYYEANMELLKSTPPIDLYQNNWPIRTYSGQYPPARTVPGGSGTEGICINAIVANGVVISGGSAQHSILFAGVYLDDEAMVQNSILFEGVHVGEAARINNAIIDKTVKIPAGETIGYDSNRDRERFTVTPKGIVIVPQDYRFG
jgi:glucose-1-phosphate adenylyltransferase